MKRFCASLTVVASVVILSGIVTARTAAAVQQSPCENPLIRKQAIVLARAINTAQMRSFQAKRVYQPLTALGVTIPDGFDVQLFGTPAGYIFSVKETREACTFTLFSDQEGRIYIAQPLQ